MSSAVSSSASRALSTALCIDAHAPTLLPCGRDVKYESDSSTDTRDPVPFPIQGTGEETRAFVHVDDFTEGVMTILEHGQHRQIYNIGAGNETPNRVLVDKLLGVFGVGEEMVQYVEDRKGHDRRYSVNIDKISALGWRLQRTFDDSLAETVAWYREHLEPILARTP